MSKYPQDLNPLIPSHFLFGDVATAAPEIDVEVILDIQLSYYQKLQRLTQHVWKR